MALLVPCQTYSSWQICWSGMRSSTAPEPPAWSTSAQQPQAEPGAPTFPDPPDAPWAMPTGSGPAVLAVLPAAAAAAGCAREIKRLKIERVCGTGHRRRRERLLIGRNQLQAVKTPLAPALSGPVDRSASAGPGPPAGCQPQSPGPQLPRTARLHPPQHTPWLPSCRPPPPPSSKDLRRCASRVQPCLLSIGGLAPLLNGSSLLLPPL
jgi:hypothetical protein